MSSTSTTNITSACVSCGHQNAADDQFCAECGHSLYERCVGCGESVLLTQKFCGSCGANLQQTRETKTDQFQRWLTEGIELGKAFNFEQSIAMLQRVAQQEDHRLNELATQARQAIDTITEYRQRATSSAEQAIAMAEEAFAREEREKVIGLLQKVPAALMTPAAKELLTKSQAHLDQIASLHAEIQEAVARKDWLFIGQNIDVLIGLVPENVKYKKLAEQVTDKLLNRASRKFGRQDYSGAKQQLSSVPQSCRTARFLDAEKNVQNLEWFAQQFEHEPYVTPTLGRLAARFVKQSPNDEQASKLFQELSAANKQRPERPRLRHASWRGSRKSWLGGKAGLLAFPKSIELAKAELIGKHPGRFSVAIGLALQGLGKARVEEQFCPKKGRKQAFLSKLGKRDSSCWGIDVGSSGIDAVLLAIPKVFKGESERIELVDSYFVEFDSPTCRLTEKEEGSGKTVVALKAMAEQLEFGDEPVWVNLPARQLVTRFLRLPPIGDKEAGKLMAQEAEQRIPLPIGDLQMIQWLAELGGDSIHGRPAAISAAKKMEVEKRLALFNAANIQVSGMQADPIALVNFLTFEFAELWSSDLDGKESEAEDHDSNPDARSPAVALIDSGAATTTLIIVSVESFWFYTVESAGEDLTALFARTTKSDRADAEELKRNPVAIDQPAAAFAQVERKLSELRARLKQMAADGLKQDGRFDIVESWCVGGAAATHGWIRHVMLNGPE